jgi:hypothetical protein
MVVIEDIATSREPWKRRVRALHNNFKFYIQLVIMDAQESPPAAPPIMITFIYLIINIWLKY